MRRIAGEVVPFLVAVAAGWCLWPFLGVLGGVLGLLAGLAVSFVLARVRRHRVLRILWRVALLLHVAFWSWQGVREGSLREAGPVQVFDVQAWQAASHFRAGFAEAPFEFDRAPLAGYGSRARREALPAFGGFGVLGRWSLRTMDPDVPMLVRAARGETHLGARAMALVPDEPGPPHPLVVVRLDLVVLDESLAEEIEDDLLTAGLGHPTLLLAASHTHSGPGGTHAAPLAQVVGTDHLDPSMRRSVVAATRTAVLAAVQGARPARIAFASARDRDGEGKPVLARNRHKRDDAEVDDRVLALRIEDAGDRHLLGLLLDYSVHPTVLGPRHHAFSKDLAGAVEDALSERLPGRPPVLFLQGALGDVGPRRSDAPAVELGGEQAVAALAARFADPVAPALLAGESYARLRVRSARARRDLGSAHTFVCAGSREAFARDVAPGVFAGGVPGAAAGVLSFPVNVLPWSLGLSEMRVGFSFGGSAGGLVNLDRAVNRKERTFGALVLEAQYAKDGPPAERLPVLWLPGEATETLGKSWRAEASRRGLSTAMIFGLTNGSMAYVATPEEYGEQRCYEAVMTLYGPRTSTHVGEAMFAALEAALTRNP